ncbi:type VII secretion protein EccB [Mycolicibacterium mageritense]|uniref:type VII secretion protein EccB n=1 Tax=Mycolicibacterium mageritense TaxID=53462 RepID=UPI001E362935|nr:type VII secretion protein EccB [Mycolicibacterium mageritense]MCC9184358.1 type VII secretion protein EccB [Mycolicibacterium mageritense]
MALNLVSRMQVRAHYFVMRRNAAALSHHGVRLLYDPELRRMAAVTLGIVFVMLGIGLMYFVGWIKPAGQAGNAKILADRDTGDRYVIIDGRAHPVLNLTSAKLITGDSANPKFVKASEIAKYPSGPLVGIVGAPESMPIRTGAPSQWALCDIAPIATPTESAAEVPTVTALAGQLSLGPRIGPLPDSAAVLGSHGGKTYVVWGGKRSEVDLSNKAVALALGVDSTAPSPIPLSTALFDAIPATDPLTSPVVPEAGSPARWDLGPGVVVGSVVTARGLQSGEEAFYVVLPNGVQRISPFVAALLRSTNSFGDAQPAAIEPDRLAAAPVVNTLPVSFYPERRLKLIDTAVNNTTCLSWAKGPSDRSATITVLNGQKLPIPEGAERQLVPVVKTGSAGHEVEADQVFVDRNATNLVMTTRAAPTADTRESMWWLSNQGVRFGVDLDQNVLSALGIVTASAQQAPWVLLRAFPAGPALTQANAKVQHDSMDAAGGEALNVPAGATAATGG